MRVTIVAFARLREVIGSSRELELPAGSTAREAFAALARENADMQPLAATTRMARNRRIVAADEPLAEGDELALLPPVGGG